VPDRRKQWVKRRYGAIAEGGGGCCGQPGTQPAADAQKIGYRVEEIGAAPEGANLGLGCGNPLAIDSIAPGETVLDLGSGAGFDAFLAAARVAPQGRVIGVDLTPQMIRKARANAKRAGVANVEFRRGDIEALPVEDASVDLVISNCVLNLVPDKAQAFREIARVLTPGGRIAIADLVLDKPLPGWLRESEEAYCSCIGGAIDRAEYLRGLETAGLTDVRVVAEADAAELLAGDCCGAAASRLTGVVTSVHVVGKKPG
jgi:SAM-dependent methyltransferase